MSCVPCGYDSFNESAAAQADCGPTVKSRAFDGLLWEQAFPYGNAGKIVMTQSTFSTHMQSAGSQLILNMVFWS